MASKFDAVLPIVAQKVSLGFELKREKGLTNTRILLTRDLLQVGDTGFEPVTSAV